MKFITKSTKIQSIVASVLTALSLITLIMLSSLLQIGDTSKTTMAFIYTVSLVLILLIWHGIIQIKVFNDYRCKRNYLCADGILSLCMGALLLVSGILLATLQLDKIMKFNTVTDSADIRIFLTAFLLVIAIWKACLMNISIKEKHFNWWCELLFTLLWFALSILCLLTMFIKSSGLVWAIVAVGWALIALTVFYILYSYVIKTPDYLRTEEAVKEVEEQIEKQNKENNKNLNASFRLQEKLKKLKDLKDQGLITDEEYTNKKNQLLDTF